MDYKREAEKAVAFFEPVRTAIDTAELDVLMRWDVSYPLEAILRLECLLGVAVRNLLIARDAVQGMRETYEGEAAIATAVDGAAAGSTVSAEQKTGGHRLS